ncbi:MULTISPECIES: hypothetical protein [Paenibacillus]|uniref:Uncharacterized protein n=1 Tax=Paenibacillus borealis TaxID=160799 RepID=A0ABX3HMA8_PAEBO|nr:hypothetical protein [Paenibacillus borealis]OMD51876.1 hypothetical protein BSK56_04430 [Paenibacillus borealis]
MIKQTHFWNYKKEKIVFDVICKDFEDKNELVNYFETQIDDEFSNVVVILGEEINLRLDHLFDEINRHAISEKEKEKYREKVRKISKRLTGRTIVKRHFRKVRNRG